METDAIFRGLTEAQRAAVEHIHGPLLVLAGPGSGKTRVITHRIANMVRSGIPPWQILTLTFTNKAAEELKTRITRLMPGTRIWAGTFHKFCATILREYAPLVGLKENFSIYDRDDQMKILKQSIEESNVELFHYTPEQIQGKISNLKNKLITPSEYEAAPGDPLGKVIEPIFKMYQRRLLDSNAVDFDDLLVHVAKMLRDHPEFRRALDAKYRYVLVDEYQDTNFAQYAIVRALSMDYPNLAVTGDPDQSIYGWRGADINNILDFEKDFKTCQVVRLEENYRSTKAILSVADQLIQNNVYRKHKELFTGNPDGSPVRLICYPNYVDEADGIAEQIRFAVAQNERRPSDFAIFYRMNSLSRTLERSLRERGIPYQIVNGVAFYQRKEIKDLVAYLLLINNPSDDIAFERIINVPSRKIGKITVDRIREYARRARVPMMVAAKECMAIPGVSARTAKPIMEFVKIIDRLSLLATKPVEEIIGQLLIQTKYREVLADSQLLEDQERVSNIDELLSAAHEFDSRNAEEGGGLEAFLEQVALVADTDAFDGESDRVTLMTLHAAKGLEFPVVYIVACEDNILPHSRAKDDAKEREEERRLLFVGITRAEAELQLSMAHYRVMRGSEFPTVPSPFLLELPREEMEWIDHGPRATYSSTFEENDWHYNQDFTNVQQAIDAEAENIKAIKARSKPTPQISTASEWQTPTLPAERPPPQAFQHGSRVNHPDYGSGQIVALSGNGNKRIATVRFHDGVERRYILAFCPLQLE